MSVQYDSHSIVFYCDAEKQAFVQMLTRQSKFVDYDYLSFLNAAKHKWPGFNYESLDLWTYQGLDCSYHKNEA